MIIFIRCTYATFLSFVLVELLQDMIGVIWAVGIWLWFVILQSFSLIIWKEGLMNRDDSNNGL